MKKILLISTILTTGLSYTQENKSINKISIDLNYGINKPTSVLTSGYSSKINPLHADLGIRYMLNTKCGIKLDAGIDNFKSKVSSYDFDSKYLRFSLQGIINVGSLIGFNDSRFGLLLHGGVGTAPPTVAVMTGISRTVIARNVGTPAEPLGAAKKVFAVVEP